MNGRVAYRASVQRDKIMSCTRTVGTHSFPDASLRIPVPAMRGKWAGMARVRSRSEIFMRAVRNAPA